MRSSSLAFASTLIAATLAAPTDAPVVTNNIPGMWAIANMPAGGDPDIVGQISVATSAKGGVAMVVNFNGGPVLSGGPFSKSNFRQIATSCS
jgi:hypothetical protein